MGEIIVGTCGYSWYKPPSNWKEKYKSKLQAYSDFFPVGEINRTFYKLPMVKTAERWKREAFNDFEFTLKAWQALTHPVSSPTWKKNNNLTESQKENFGYLRPNYDVIDAWKKTRKIVDALGADICVIQTPGSFDCSVQHEENIHQFLNSIDREDIAIAWEPRGNWKENEDKVKDICNEHEIIHVVDLMRKRPLSSHPISYIRLHGLNQDEYNYNYDYSQEEIEELSERLNELAENKEKVYCMFNNYQMHENAKALMELI